MMKEELHEAAAGTPEDPLSFLAVTAVFGELAQSERFAKAYAEQVKLIYETSDISSLMKLQATQEPGGK